MNSRITKKFSNNLKLDPFCIKIKHVEQKELIKKIKESDERRNIVQKTYNDSYDGVFLSDELSIYIDKNKLINSTKCVYDLTLIHEILHAIINREYDEMLEDDFEESLVTAISKGVYSLIKNNKELIEYFWSE